MGLFIPGNPHDLGSGERTLTFAFNASRCTFASVHKAWAGRQQGPHLDKVYKAQTSCWAFPQAQPWPSCPKERQKLEWGHLQQTGDPTGRHQPPAASRRNPGHCLWGPPLHRWPCRTQPRTCQSQRGGSGLTASRGEKGIFKDPTLWLLGNSYSPQRRCVNSTRSLQKGLGKAKPTQNGRENKGSHPHWTASQYFYPIRKAVGFSIQGFKGPGECRMARTEPVSASLRLIFSPLNDTTVPWPGSLDCFRGN